MLSSDWRGQATSPSLAGGAAARQARGLAERAPGLWNGLRFGAGVLVVTVVALLLLDVALFDLPGVGRRLPFERDNGSPNDKVLLAARYQDAEVLYLGDSRTYFGFDPEVVSEKCRCGPGYNAGTPGMDPSLTRMLADQLLETLEPKLVVIGVSQWELSDAADIHVEDPARELVPLWQLAQFGASPDPKEIPREAAETTWRLYRYRAEVRRALERWASGGRSPDPRRGFRVYDDERRLRDKDLDYRERQWFTDFSVEGDRAAELRALLAELRRRDLPVLLVAPPLYPPFHKQVRKQVDEYRRAMERISAEQAVDFVDLTRAGRSDLTDEHFLDVVHLTEQGANRLSRQLGKILRSRYGEGLRALQ